MIDQKTFQVLNPSNTGFNLPAAINPKDELSADQLERDEPPDEYFQYLLPLTIKGYNLRRKKWYDVAVDRISPVVWNKQVFETLVMDRKSKDLIQALISKQVSSQKSTDLIVGKGNGLILLLHGGPGTGKTLTAESVAEIAEKPLYRVTCGDVGTKAEDVEKYLESVLHLGKIWDCVVLLDEADGTYLSLLTHEDMHVKYYLKLA
jgi:Cdc6-like AAA superfamily ATPase